MKRLAVLAFSLTALCSLSAEEVKFTVSEFKFTAPDGWKKVEPKSTMRKAQFEIPGKDGGKPAELTFFFFGDGQGGDVQANTQRWFGQFTSKPDAQKAEPQDFNGTKVTLVTTEGTLKASPIMGITEDQPDYALLGAILEHSGGPVFAKLTGPAALVKESREKFITLIKSATEKK
jgi:hypothetical protein